MNRITQFLIVGAMLFVFASCDNNNDEKNGNNQMNFFYTFETGTEGWEADFADYPVGEDEAYELQFGPATLPSPLDPVEGALRLSGLNKSDDLFMFIKKKVTGLEPNTTYNALFNVSFASDVPDSVVGVGGSPGESVYIKAGATAVEPVPEEDSMGYYRMNIDKGNQANGGADMLVLGDFSNDTEMEDFVLKTVSSEGMPFTVTSNENGELWFIVGTDSGFESTTTIYYNDINVYLDK